MKRFGDDWADCRILAPLSMSKRTSLTGRRSAHATPGSRSHRAWIPAFLVSLSVFGLLTSSCAEPPSTDVVLLISIDTLRADRLGCYGYGRDLSPALDALAAEGVLFRQAVSQAPWTIPSHMSLMTSLYPSSHTVNQDHRQFVRFQRNEGNYRILPSEVQTLAEILKQHGFRTLALTGGGTMSAKLGFGRGFDTYLETARKLQPKVWSQLTDWLSEPDPAGRPLFLFFHTFEVHAPHIRIDDARPLLSPEQAAGLYAFTERRYNLTEATFRRYLEEQGLLRVEMTSRLYDGGIRFTDWFLGNLFDTLREQGLWQRTLVIVTSDHGEEFADHDPTRFYNAHCVTTYDEIIRVPLIFRVPGRFADGRVVEHQVRLIDVAPTLLELLDIPIPEQMQGESLVDRMAGGGADGALTAYSEATCRDLEWKSLRDQRFKYIAAFSAEAGERVGLPGERKWEQLFNVKNDPEEALDLAEAQRGRIKHMRNELAEFFTQRALPVVGGEQHLAFDEKLVEELRALGYLD